MKLNPKENEAKDAGLAVVLILLLVVLFGEKQSLLFPAIICLVLVMSVPSVFSWWARLWFASSHLLGAMVSRILLTIIFYGVAVPVGIVRRMAGADSMRITQWKKESGSVFVERNYLMTRKDMERPY